MIFNIYNRSCFVVYCTYLLLVLFCGILYLSPTCNVYKQIKKWHPKLVSNIKLSPIGDGGHPGDYRYSKIYTSIRVYPWSPGVHPKVQLPWLQCPPPHPLGLNWCIHDCWTTCYNDNSPEVVLQWTTTFIVVHVIICCIY